MLATLKERISAMEIDIEFTDTAIDKLAEEGFDDTYGARPLRRTIRSKIEDAVSEKLLDGTIKKGDRAVCDFENGEFVFKVQNQA